MNLSDVDSDFTAEDLASYAQRAMYGYWLDARGEAILPPKSALDPVEFPRQSLSSIAVVEPIGDGDFRIRIVGTGVRSAVGRDDTGQQVSQIPGTENALARLLQCRDTASAFYTGGPANWANGRQKFYTSLLLPFGAPQHVERIMLVFQFTHHTPANLMKPMPQLFMQPRC
ncbi:PAS domain-containing protein [Nisaea sp.]|uniref:PAS domain-containing protein n=1 Tax=Nisaea sp. TaxID=2024842 RepID=UPI0032EB4E7F